MFFNHPKYRVVESGQRSGEDVYSACGYTNSNRYVIAFFIYKKPNTAFILSARDMDNKERKRYERK